MAQALRQSLLPYKSQLELNNSFRPGQMDDPPVGVFDLIAGIHRKEEHISNPKGTPPTVGTIYSSYFVNRGSRAFQLGNVISTTTNEWIELQGAIYGTYVLLDPISLIPFLPSVEWSDFFLNACGILRIDGDLLGADESVLWVPLTYDPIEFASKWNELKVPYDASIGVQTEYTFGIEPSVVDEGITWLRQIGLIPIDQQAAIDYWNFSYPFLVSR